MRSGPGALIHSHFPLALFGSCPLSPASLLPEGRALSYPPRYFHSVATMRGLCSQLAVADSGRRQVFSWKVITSSQMSPLLGPVFGDFQAFSVWGDDMCLHLSLSVLFEGGARPTTPLLTWVLPSRQLRVCLGNGVDASSPVIFL